MNLASSGWVTRFSTRGLPYQIWQPMPWIDPQFLECAVYLYPSEKEAEEGDRIGGSGFVLGIDVGQVGIGRSFIFCVVTNRHVIDSGNMVVRINTINGGRDILALDAAKWYFHKDGDDLAVCPVRLSAMHRPVYNHLPSHMLLTKKTIDDLEIGPGDEVFVIGRFVNHEGKQRNLPSVRFGNIAQMPWEPIVIAGQSQESFLVEAHSISGYSGSPVFVFLPPPPVPANLNPQIRKIVNDGKMNLPGVSKKRFNLPIQIGPWILGVDYCHIRWDEPVWNKQTNSPVNDDWFVKSNTGMMGVVPAWKLAEILEGDEMKPVIETAREAATKAAKTNAAVELDVADLSKSSPPSTDANPKHREDFNSLVDAAARKREQED